MLLYFFSVNYLFMIFIYFSIRLLFFPNFFFFNKTNKQTVFVFLFWPCHMACRILVPTQG